MYMLYLLFEEFYGLMVIVIYLLIYFSCVISGQENANFKIEADALVRKLGSAHLDGKADI